MALFWECVSEAKAETKETSVKAVDDFLARKKVVRFFWNISLIELDIIVI